MYVCCWYFDGTCLSNGVYSCSLYLFSFFPSDHLIQRHCILRYSSRALSMREGGMEGWREGCSNKGVNSVLTSSPKQKQTPLIGHSCHHSSSDKNNREKHGHTPTRTKRAIAGRHEKTARHQAWCGAPSAAAAAGVLVSQTQVTDRLPRSFCQKCFAQNESPRSCALRFT